MSVILLPNNQSLHALNILCSYGMSDDALVWTLSTRLWSYIVAKVLHAIPAWWGFTAASDRQKLDAFIRHGVR